MTEVMAAAMAVVLGAAVEVPAGAPLAPALDRAKDGDVVRLGPGVHRGSLGRRSGIRVEGAGASATVVAAPEGADGAVAAGALELARLTLRAGPERCALKVLGGDVRAEDVALHGGSCGAYVESGRLSAKGILLSGRYGLLAKRAEVSIDGGSAQGGAAGIAQLGRGRLALRRVTVTGPSREAAISVAGGTATLEEVAVRRPGPVGIAISGGGRLEGVAVSVAGAVEAAGNLGDCVQVVGGSVRLEGGRLAGCAGAALEASRAEVVLRGVDAAGGSAGCLVLVDGTVADLSGNVCTGSGPGLVVASGSRARLRANRWRTDPMVLADCESGASVEAGPGEAIAAPCRSR